MSKFKVGDRVRYKTWLGTVVGTCEGYGVYTHYEVDFGPKVAKFFVSESGLKKLKPKKPLRTFWINNYESIRPEVFYKEGTAHNCRWPNSPCETIEVREVRRKTKK